MSSPNSEDSISASRARIHALEQEGNSKARLVNRLLSQPAKMIGAVLLGNTLVDVLAASLAYVRVYGRLLSRHGIAWTLEITLLLLAFGGIAIRAILALLPQALDTPGAHVALYGVKLYALLWFIALYSLQWSFSRSMA